MSQAWGRTGPSRPRERLGIERWLAENEARREDRRNLIASCVGRELSRNQLEKIVALSTGLEALYDLGAPQDLIICQWMRKHPNRSIDDLIDRATWVFVAK